MEDAGNGVKSNPTGGKKVALKRHKILVFLLWSKTVNLQKNQCIHKDFITKVNPESKAFLKDALDLLGIIIDVVEKYLDTITKLMSKSENRK